MADGVIFNNNTVVYDINVPPTTLTFVQIDREVGGGQVINNVNGFNAVINYLFFPGIPPPPAPVPYVTGGLTQWEDGEQVVVTGPAGPGAVITLTGAISGQIAIFNPE